MKNEFNSDKERIEELVTALEFIFNKLNTHPDMRSAGFQARVISRDVLSRFKQNKKYLTASQIKANTNGMEIVMIND